VLLVVETLRVCRSAEGEREREKEKKDQVGPAWGSVTHQVLTDRGLIVSLSFCQSGNVPISLRAAGAGILLWPPVAPVICQNILSSAAKVIPLDGDDT